MRATRAQAPGLPGTRLPDYQATRHQATRLPAPGTRHQATRHQDYQDAGYQATKGYQGLPGKSRSKREWRRSHTQSPQPAHKSSSRNRLGPQSQLVKFSKQTLQNMCVLPSKADRDVLGPQQKHSDPLQVPRLHTNMKSAIAMGSEYHLDYQLIPQATCI